MKALVYEDVGKLRIDGRIDPLPIISHTLPLEEVPKGYELFDRREPPRSS